MSQASGKAVQSTSGSTAMKYVDQQVARDMAVFYKIFDAQPTPADKAVSTAKAPAAAKTSAR